jgi:hypothetical protein
MVVSGTSEDFARLRPGRRALPPVRGGNSAHRAKRPLDILLREVPEMNKGLFCEYTCTQEA